MESVLIKKIYNEIKELKEEIKVLVANLRVDRDIAKEWDPELP